MRFDYPDPRQIFSYRPQRYGFFREPSRLVSPRAIPQKTRPPSATKDRAQPTGRPRYFIKSASFHRPKKEISTQINQPGCTNTLFRSACAKRSQRSAHLPPAEMPAGISDFRENVLSLPPKEFFDNIVEAGSEWQPASRAPAEGLSFIRIPAISDSRKAHSQAATRHPG